MRLYEDVVPDVDLAFPRVDCQPWKETKCIKLK